MKKTLKEQLDRSQELIQFDNSGAEERTSSPTTYQRKYVIKEV